MLSAGVGMENASGVGWGGKVGPKRNPVGLWCDDEHQPKDYDHLFNYWGLMTLGLVPATYYGGGGGPQSYFHSEWGRTPLKKLQLGICLSTRHVLDNSMECQLDDWRWKQPLWIRGTAWMDMPTNGRRRTTTVGSLHRCQKCTIFPDLWSWGVEVGLVFMLNGNLDGRSHRASHFMTPNLVDWKMTELYIRGIFPLLLVKRRNWVLILIVIGE